MDRQGHGKPLLEDIDGPVLVELGNWVAEALDATELSNQQVLLLYVLLERGMDALWRNFPDVLMPLCMRAMARVAMSDEEEE